MSDDTDMEGPLVASAAYFEGLARLSASGRLFAVADSADAPFAAAKAREFGADAATCLFRLEEREDLADVAPYLFHIADPALIRWVKDALATDAGFCVFAVADTNMEGLRRHFRRFMPVLSPAGMKLNFRFYEPRVLRTFLESCTPQELNEFYGPASEYGVPMDDGRGALFFKRREEQSPRHRAKGTYFKLRPAHMQAFADSSEKRFVGRVVEFLQSRFPDAADEPYAVMHDAIAEQIARARAHGFSTELEIVTYVVSAWLLGPEFDTSLPEVAEALASPLMSPGDKAAWLAEWTEQMFRSLEEEA